MQIIISTLECSLCDSGMEVVSDSRLGRHFHINPDKRTYCLGQENQFRYAKNLGKLE